MSLTLSSTPTRETSSPSRGLRHTPRSTSAVKTPLYNGTTSVIWPTEAQEDHKDRPAHPPRDAPTNSSTVTLAVNDDPLISKPEMASMTLTAATSCSQASPPPPPPSSTYRHRTSSTRLTMATCTAWCSCPPHANAPLARCAKKTFCSPLGAAMRPSRCVGMTWMRHNKLDRVWVASFRFGSAHPTA
jgi:hypothetical protein